MTAKMLTKQDRLRALLLISATLAGGAITASAQTYFSPGNLVVSRSVYDNNPNNVKIGQIFASQLHRHTRRLLRAGCLRRDLSHGLQ